MSFAQWNPSTLVEREEVLLRRQYGRQQWLNSFLAVAAICLATSGGLWLLVLYVQTGKTEYVLGLCLLSMALVAGGVAISRREKALTRRKLAADFALREEFGGGQGWFVDLYVLQGDAPTGADRGMLWFEGDRLFFSGHRTSFGLTPDQADGPLRVPWPLHGLRHEFTLPLLHWTEAGKLAISFSPTAVDGEGIRSLREEARTWLTAPTKGNGQLPPTALGPGAPPRLLVFAQALWPTIYWLFTAALTLTLPEPILFLILGAAIALPLRCWYPGTRWRAWRDLGRAG